MPRYDAEAARAAGIPEAEIRKQMMQGPPRLGVRDVLRASAQAPMGSPMGVQTTGALARGVAGVARMVGPMAGGARGGPMGAYAGGALGEGVAAGVESLVGEGPESFGEARDDMARAGALGAVSEALPLGVRAGMKRAAPHVANAALKVSSTLRRNFPDVDFEKVFLREKIPVQRGSTTGGGEAVAEGRRIASSQAEADAIDAAHAGGLSGYTPSEIAYGPATRRNVRTTRDGIFGETDPRQIKDLIENEFLTTNPRTVTRGQNANGVRGQIKLKNVIKPQKVQRVRQSAGAVAFARPDRPIGAMARGATEPNARLYARSLWENATSLMERDIPDFAANNARTQELMALEQALGMREMPAQAGGWMGALHLASHPNFSSRAAIAADDPFLQALLGRVPQAAFLGVAQGMDTR